MIDCSVVVKIVFRFFFFNDLIIPLNIETTTYRIQKFYIPCQNKIGIKQYKTKNLPLFHKKPHKNKQNKQKTKKKNKTNKT